MASSFIVYKSENGFWVDDSLMEVTCYFIAKIILERKSNLEWLNTLHQHLINNSAGLYPSYMHLNLTEYLINQSRETYFLEILNDLHYLLRAQGPVISIQELNSFIINSKLQSEWKDPLEANIIVDIVDKLINLIKSEISTSSK